jgi:hypothetical protein
MFRSKSRKQDAPDQPQDTPGERFTVVTDSKGHTTGYVGVTARQAEAIQKAARDERAAAEFLARWQ